MLEDSGRQEKVQKADARTGKSRGARHIDETERESHPKEVLLVG